MCTFALIIAEIIMNQEEFTRTSLCADEKIISRKVIVCLSNVSTTGFLETSSLPKSDYIKIRKSKCSGIERYFPNQAVYSALQTMTRENTRNENGKSKILGAKLIRLDLCVVAGKS